MKIYWVLLYSDYCPSPDNFQASFYTKEEAQKYIDSNKTPFESMKTMIVNIEDRL
jgi:hypothetical protein